MKVTAYLYKKYVNHWRKKRDRLAAKNSPRWLELENDPDDKFGKRFEAVMEQIEIESIYCPQTKIMKIKFWLDDHGPSAIKMNLINFYQRGKNGFAAQDLWALDYYLSGMISKALEKLSDTTDGYPTIEPYNQNGGFALWQADLRKAAKFIKSATIHECDHPNIVNDKCYYPAYCNENNKQFLEAWEWIGKYFYNLWD